MVASSKSQPVRRRWFRTLSLLAIVGVVAVGGIVWHAIELSSLSQVSRHIAAAQQVAAAFRFAVIGMLSLTWPWLWVFLARADDSDGRLQTRWMRLRWRVIGWLLVIELLLGQDLMGRFHVVMSAPAP